MSFFFFPTFPHAFRFSLQNKFKYNVNSTAIKKDTHSVAGDWLGLGFGLKLRDLQLVMAMVTMVKAECAR